MKETKLSSFQRFEHGQNSSLQDDETFLTLAHTMKQLSTN